MPRKPNYDFDKRRKELDRKAKRDGKREDRRLRRQQGAAEGEAPPTDEGAEVVPLEPPVPE